MEKIRESFVVDQIMRFQADNERWHSLLDLTTAEIASYYQDKSETFISEEVDRIFMDVKSRLASVIAEKKKYGEPVHFEIDNETRPFIRFLNANENVSIDIILSQPPEYFEFICKNILARLCEKASTEGKPFDDCVDFIGYSFPSKSIALNIPYNSLAVILGQAKRYQRTSVIDIHAIREFVGGALKRKADLMKQNLIAPLTPVTYAFWTTSDFTTNAKSYMRELGIWYLNGSDVSNYIKLLSIDLQQSMG